MYRDIMWNSFKDELVKLSSGAGSVPQFNQNNELTQGMSPVNLAPQRFDMTKPPPKPPEKKDYLGSSINGGLLGGMVGSKIGTRTAIATAALGAGTGSAVHAMDDGT